MPQATATAPTPRAPAPPPARIISTLTDLPRDDALALLDRAGGSVKTAAVMHHHGLSAPAAAAKLRDCAGRLDLALRPTP